MDCSNCSFFLTLSWFCTLVTQYVNDCGLWSVSTYSLEWPVHWGLCFHHFWFLIVLNSSPRDSRFKDCCDVCLCYYWTESCNGRGICIFHAVTKTEITINKTQVNANRHNATHYHTLFHILLNRKLFLYVDLLERFHFFRRFNQTNSHLNISPHIYVYLYIFYFFYDFKVMIGLSWPDTRTLVLNVVI